MTFYTTAVSSHISVHIECLIMYIRVAFSLDDHYLSSLIATREHSYGGNFVLPNHSPEIYQRLWGRTCVKKEVIIN